MLKPLLSTLVLLVGGAAAAQPVVLIPNSNLACGTDGNALSRMTVRSDGTLAYEATEFVVPAGYELEVTDFSYGLGTPNAPGAEFIIELLVFNRSSPWSYWALHRGGGSAFGRQFAYGGSRTAPTQTGWVTRGFSDHVTFGTPFPFGPAARLCVSSPIHGLRPFTDVRVVGRLVPARAAPPDPSTPPVLQ